MKKLVLFAALISLAATSFAYNPPAGGQLLNNLTSPFQLSSASSVAGGGIFSAQPGSICFNPALTAFEDRPQIDLGVTALVGSGAAFETGIVIPMNMFVITGLVQGVSSNVKEMDLGNSISVRGGLSKEVTENISVGANVYGGYLFSDGGDWSCGAEIGALWRMEKLGFMKDFRIGASLLGLGKQIGGTKHGLEQNDREKYWDDLGFVKYFVWPFNALYDMENLIDHFDGDNNSDEFPGFLTIRTGGAFTVFETDFMKGGVSADFTLVHAYLPIFDFGYQMTIKDSFYLRASYTLDINELSKESITHTSPALGFGYKLTLDTGKSGFMKDKGWDKSDLTVSTAYQNLYEDIHAISAGANFKFGQPDEEAPSIQIWGN